MPIKHIFLGKNCLINKELTDQDNLKQHLTKNNISCNKILFLKQIHSNKIVTIDHETKIYNNNNRPQADGIITNIKNIAIAVITADCAPILFYDQKQNIIAATHVGWRGAFDGVIENTLNQLAKINAGNISAIIGPMIQQNSYEVSKDLYDIFCNQDINNKIFFKAKNNLNINRSDNEQKYLFDLNQLIYQKLSKYNIKNITNLKIDTLSNEQYHSYRQSTLLKQNNQNRNISLICIN
jgi:YfiH family protein